MVGTLFAPNSGGQVRFCLVLAALLFVALVASATAKPSWGDAMVNSHNGYRAAVNPPATNMRKLVWDDKLAKVAANYAETCKFKHNNNRTIQYKAIGGTGYVGENLAVGTGATKPEQAVKMWNREVSFFNYNAFTCEKGKQCGHYIQANWANSAKVGCAYKLCKNNIIANKNAHLWVCNYTPGGFLPGQRPYTTGQRCSKCPSGTKCSGGLCA